MLFYKKICLKECELCFLKQNYCHAYHTSFAVLFPLPSCYVSSQLLTRERWINFHHHHHDEKKYIRFYTVFLQKCHFGGGDETAVER